MPLDSPHRIFVRNPFLAATELSLADVLSRINEDPTLDLVHKRDMTSAVRRIAGLLGRDPAMLSAKIVDLRPGIAGLTPAGTGLTAKTLANLMSNLMRALRLHGDGQSLNNGRQHLSLNWKELLARVQNKRIEAGLSRFARFCSAAGIDPTEVDDAVVERFVQAIREGTFVRKVELIHRGTCRIWNEAAARIPGWPQRPLTLPDYRKPRWSTPLTAFPAAFQADLDDCLHWLQDPLADPPPPRTCRDQTIKNIKEAVTLAAAALLQSGKSIDSFAGLADLVEYEAVKAICRVYRDRMRGEFTTQIRLIVSWLIHIASHWVHVAPADLERLKVLRRQLGHNPLGLTNNNRETLRQFDDPENLRRLLLLPQSLFDEAMSRRPVSIKAAILAQIALAIEILIVAPMRMRNLIGLRVDRHIVWHGANPCIVLPAEETKTREPAEYPLGDQTAKILETYLARFRPLLDPSPGGCLFPSRVADLKQQSTLAGQVQRLIRKRTGIAITPHQFRHLMAKLMLDAQPGSYGAVQRVLGHSSSKTTTNFYAGFDVARAARLYDAELAKLREGFARLPAPRRRGQEAR